MKRYIICALAALLTIVTAKAEDRHFITGALGYGKLADVLVQNQAWVPYPAYSDRSGWDALMGEYKEDIIKSGEKYLDYEWLVIRMSDYQEYEISGNRAIMENRFFANNNAIAALFAAELAEGRGRFIPQIINGVIHTCEMTSWSLSAHLAGLNADNRAIPKEGDTTLELFQGEVSQLFSWIYYFLHEEFDKIFPELSRRLKSELMKREIEPYLARTDFWWMGFDPDNTLNNWNPWCNANAILTFMLIEDDINDLAKGIWKTMWSVDQYLNRIKGDGGIDEGPSYWSGSAGEAYKYLAALTMVTGGKVPFFDNKQVRDMGEYIVNSYVGDDWVVNFADASARGGANGLNLIYRYGKDLGSATMMGFAAERANGKRQGLSASTDMFNFFEFLRAEKELESANTEFEKPSYVWYPETEFHYARNADGVFFAAKAGYNDESHNHNDVGSFNLYSDSLPVFIDAGVETYTAKTFSSRRYEIWTMQSDYHSLPKINGVPQHNGKEYKAKDVKSTATTFSADIAGAYPEEAAVKSWVRSYALAGKTLTIGDKFELSETKAANQVNFMTWGDVDVSTPGIVSIDVKGKQATLKYDSNTFEATKEAIKLEDPKLRNVWGDEICRITLTAKRNQVKGTYKYVISLK